MEKVFWIAVGIIVYTYLGYGLLLYIIVKVKEWICPPPPMLPVSMTDELPEVTLFITAYNEEEVVDAKMHNSLALHYPPHKLHILWVTDGSTDQTNDILISRWSAEATVSYEAERRGKMAAMTRGMSMVHTPLVVFTDANAMLNADAMLHLVGAFRQPDVGGATGSKRIAVHGKERAAIGGEGLYWRYESKLKELDSRLSSAIGAVGELFAMRSELYEALPPDTLLDDFMLSMRLVMKGYRIAYCSQACALECGSANMHEEEKRKVRIAAGGLQSIVRLLPLLNPFRYGILTFQYLSHRVLRWTVTPVLFFLLLPLTVLLLNMGCSPVLYGTMLTIQTAGYTMSIWGVRNAERPVRNNLLFAPCYILFMNLNVWKGLGYLIRRRHQSDSVWEKSIRSGYAETA